MSLQDSNLSTDIHEEDNPDSLDKSDVLGNLTILKTLRDVGIKNIVETQPSTLETKRERLFYLQMHDFLVNNPEAIFLLESAGDDQQIWEYAKQNWQAKQNTENFKLGTRIGAKIFNVKNPFERGEVSTSNSVDSRLLSYIHKIANEVTINVYSCEHDPYCLPNVRGNFREVMQFVEENFDNFPRFKNEDSEWLDFESMKANVPPKQAQMVEVLSKLDKLDQLDKLQNISETNRHNLEALARQGDQNAQETLKALNEAKTEMLVALREHNTNISNSMLSDIEAMKQQQEYDRIQKALRQDPDYRGIPSNILSLVNAIEDYEKAKDTVKNKYENGEITENEYLNEISTIDTAIAKKKTDTDFNSRTITVFHRSCSSWNAILKQ